MRKFLLVILFALLAYLIFNKYAVQFVWVNPNANTKVFPYISKAVRELDNALNYSILAMKSSQYEVKVKYKNAYGSGFIKNNPIPNDLDYSLGIWLGEYEYDGKNAEEIAKSIDEKMTLFQTEFYNYVGAISPGKFYSNYDALSSIQKLYNKRNANIKSISESIPKLFEHKDYIVYTTKTLLDDNQNPLLMTFPFILKKNEILIEDYSPLTFYTPYIKYAKDTRNMLRELTVVVDFYVTVKKGEEAIEAEIVAESFTGQRLQLTRRFFVPVVFAGNASAKYLKKLSLLTDDDTYIEYRMFNFKRHLQEFSNLKEMQERPIKLFKRVLQCTDLALPLLDKNTVNDMTATIVKNLNKPEIKLINDYQTAFSNLIQMSGLQNLFLKAQSDNGQITKHIDAMLKIVEEMKASGAFDKEFTEAIEKATTEVKEQAAAINSPEKLKEFQTSLLDRIVQLNPMLNKKIVESVTEMDKILSFIETFNKMMNMAGFHKIDMCWLNNDLIGIVKDDFTKNIPEKELKNFAKQNNLADVNYRFISAAELAGPKVRYAVWVRYNPTAEEEKVWQQMRSELLADKKNFKVKRRFTFPVTFYRIPHSAGNIGTDI